MKRRFLTVILLLCFLLSLMLPAHGYDEQQVAADTLHGLGLFKGVGTKDDGSPDYALERSLSRQEAVTMLVRLLGKEQQAQNGQWDIPFTDVDAWAIPYVGYAYANGLTTGMSDTSFGGRQQVTAAQYLTFVLRALNYASGEDFVWNAAWEKTDHLGITSGQYSEENNGRFLRGDAVYVSSNALRTCKKAGQSTLLEQLVAEGAVKQETAERSGLLPDEYVLFAREIIAAGKDPVTVSLDENDMMGRTALAPIFKEYDGFPGSAATLELALAEGLKGYLKECIDGDYSDGYSGTPSFRNWNSWTDAFFLTDTKGTIIAYGVRTDKTSKDFTLYFCKVNSKTFMDARVEETRAELDSVAEIPCEANREGNQYVFRFSALPEDAVWFEAGLYGAKTATSKRGYEVDRWLLSYWSSLKNGFLPDTPVQETYSCEAFYTEYSGTAYRLFWFMDADYNLIGYSLGTIPLR